MGWQVEGWMVGRDGRIAFMGMKVCHGSVYFSADPLTDWEMQLSFVGYPYYSDNRLLSMPKINFVRSPAGASSTAVFRFNGETVYSSTGGSKYPRGIAPGYSV